MVAYCLMTSIFTNGCATPMRSTFVGISTGAAVGAAGGAILGHEKGEAAWQSALVMGAIGGIAGYFTHKGLEDRDAEVRKETLFNLEKFGVSGVDDSTSSKNSKQNVLIITDPNWSKDSQGDGR